MTLLDFTYIFQWWFLLASIGVIFLPLTTLIFQNFFDRGYIFSKILGVLILSYSIWLLANLRILSFQTVYILVLLFGFLIINIYLTYRQRLFLVLSRSWKFFLLEEIMFFTGLTFWAFIRAHEPSIHGLEKFMDFGFINSILRTEFFPPKDLWLSGETINYYYFGHLIEALLTKLSFLKPEVTFNLMIATIFAFTFTCSFSIGANLWHFFSHKDSGPASQGEQARMTIKIILCGLLAAILVSLAGNIHPIYTFFENYSTENPVPFWQLKPKFNFDGYWYPNATRFIPLTIHEFPLYSFVVADLHGHVFNIPIVLLIVALIISIYFKEKTHFGYYLLFGFLIALMLMTNVLDGPIYLLLFSLIMIFRHKYYAFKPILLVILISINFSLPFWLNFKPFSQGIGIICAPDFLVSLGKVGPFLFEGSHCARSPFWMLVILYGFFYFVFYGFFFKIRKQITSADNLILLLMLFASILILIPEIFYVKDIYPAHYRANTVFKFGFQAFIVLSLASSFMIFRIYHNIRWHLPLILNSIFLILLLSLILIYPYFAIRSYYGELKTYSGLDGLNYLTNQYPSDYSAILWIKNNIKSQDVILEAVGESYTDYARISSNTGLPTVIGWPVHEWLWRGSPDEGTKRQEEVKSIYEDTDLFLTQNLIKKYDIKYIFIGTLEKQKYPALQEDKFSTLGQIVFQDGESKLYQLNL